MPGAAFLRPRYEAITPLRVDLSDRREAAHAERVARDHTLRSYAAGGSLYRLASHQP